METREPTMDITRRDRWAVGPSKSVVQAVLTCKFTGPPEVADQLQEAFRVIASAQRSEGRQLQLHGLVDAALSRAPSASPSGESEGKVVSLSRGRKPKEPEPAAATD